MSSLLGEPLDEVGEGLVDVRGLVKIICSAKSRLARCSAFTGGGYKWLRALGRRTSWAVVVGFFVVVAVLGQTVVVAVVVVEIGRS